MLALLILGVILFRRIGLVKEEHGEMCSALVVKVTLPALILMTLIHTDLDWSYGKMNLLLIGATFVCLLLGWLIARAFRADGPSTAAVILTAGFSSSSVLGVPLISEIYPGDKQTIIDAVVLSTIGMSPFMVTLGTMIAHYYGAEDQTPKQRRREMLGFLYSPIFVAIIAGIALRSLTQDENSLVHSVLDGLRIVSAANTFLVLLSVGLLIRLENFREIAGLAACVDGVNLIVMPLLTMGPAHLLNLEHWQIEVLALEASMPPMTISVALCAAHGANARLAAKLFFATITVSMFTVPGVLLLAGIL